MKNIYLFRHGETEWATSGRHTGTTDIALTAHGETQVAALRKRIENIPFDSVYTSPLQRARKTAPANAIIEPLLMEWNYGEYEGLKTAEIRAKNPTWDLFREGAPGGELPSQIGHRADQFLQKIRHRQGNVAVFSHGHFLRVLTARFLGLPVEDGKLFLLSVASMSILGFDREQPVVVLWNLS